MGSSIVSRCRRDIEARVRTVSIYIVEASVGQTIIENMKLGTLTAKEGYSGEPSVSLGAFSELMLVFNQESLNNQNDENNSCYVWVVARRNPSNLTGPSTFCPKFSAKTLREKESIICF